MTTRRTKPVSDYISLSETRALVRASKPQRDRITEAGNMLTCSQAARAIGCTTVQIHGWVQAGRAIGLRTSRGTFKLPAWQFEPSTWTIIASLSRAMQTTDGWALYSFLESPLGALEGRTPRHCIEAGQTELVLRLAEHA